jgi:hypothetical protein
MKARDKLVEQNCKRAELMRLATNKQQCRQRPRHRYRRARGPH